MYDNAISNGYLDITKYDINKVSTTTGKYLFKSPNFSKKRLFELQRIANKINPPITKVRFLAGIKMFIIDPVRISKFAFSYIKNLFTKLR
jgi:hypothetical protein